MKRNVLLATAAVAILASAGIAMAQDRGGKPAGAMEKAAPPGKTMQKSDTDRRPVPRQSDDARQRDNQKSGARPGTETTGRGDPSDVQLTNDQRTKIRQVVVTKKIPKVDKVNFTVSIGARVPTNVRFHPIPDEIVAIRPAWRGYRVILVGSELVIVHPRTYQIMAIIVV